jgi:hypothetical protein
MADIQTIAAKILADAAFCDKLLSNPEQTLKESGFEPTAEMIEAIKALDASSMKKLAAVFGKEHAA